MSLQSGTRLGAYEILGPLGAGGMGEVYRAKDLRLGRQVAIKVLPSEVASSPDRLARFEREARTVAGLNHPNIVTLYSVEDVDGVRFLTMELVEGQTLTSWIAPGGLPLPKLLELTIPLTDALVTAHESGVVHRDLKPGNVMVTREGRVKVLDFGLAKMTGPDPSAGRSEMFTATGDRHVEGTVPYMAPEQLRGEGVDARSDLFSLGIILHELATGRRPFQGQSVVEVSSAILRDPPEPLSRARADLPTDLERIVGRCLEKNPRDRVQSALDVNNDLRRLRALLERGQPSKPGPERSASIAVLPFANRSASADDEYFSDGLADELLNVLSKIKGLRVTARTSSFHFKGKDSTIAEIGKALDVATLLEGSVRKAGPRIRVSVQLVQVSDSSHLWAETYDRTLDDIFAVQDDIAQSVVKELRTTLLGEEANSDASGAAKADVAHAAQGRGTDPEAHRLYLLARYLSRHIEREPTAKAIGYLKEALARDPEFALAWTALAHAYGMEADAGWVPAREGYGRSREALQRALALDPDLAEAQVRMAWIRWYHDWDFRGAVAICERALQLYPGDGMVLRIMGALYTNLGRFEEAIALTRRALEQDPLSPAAHSNLGITFFASDRLVEAETSLRQALDVASPAGVRATLALVLLAQGRGDEALEEAQRETDSIARLQVSAVIFHRLGRASESDAALREMIESHSVEPRSVADVHALRGEPDAAFEWLERAYAIKDTALAEMKGTPGLRRLHADPRWGPFLRKMEFPE